jgi:zinc/manganese transport system substrate-binding protein
MKKLLLSFVIASSLATSTLAELNVVTSFSILEDIAHNIGKDKVKITSMVKRNQDPHGYDPSFSDIQNLYKADLLIVNGLNFENWLNHATQQANFKGEIITVSKGVNVIHLEDDHDHNHDEESHNDHGHDHGDVDPHIWQNPLNGIIMAENITQAFIAKDPDNKAFYEKNFETYSQQLRDLDNSIREKLQNNPSQPLKGIVLHDSFRYFTERYPMQFFPILNAHSISEPSVKTFAGIKTLINDNQIPVIFAESMEQNRFIATVVNDYNIVNGGQLISDTILDFGKECDSYIGILECNVKTIDQAFETVRSDQ